MVTLCFTDAPRWIFPAESRATTLRSEELWYHYRWKYVFRVQKVIRRDDHLWVCLCTVIWSEWLATMVFFLFSVNGQYSNSQIHDHDRDRGKLSSLKTAAINDFQPVVTTSPKKKIKLQKFSKTSSFKPSQTKAVTPRWQLNSQKIQKWPQILQKYIESKPERDLQALYVI